MVIRSGDMGWGILLDERGNWSSDEVITGGDIYWKSTQQQWRKPRREARILVIRLLVVVSALLLIAQSVEGMSTSNSPGEQSGTSTYVRPGTRPNIGPAMVKKLKTQTAVDQPTQVRISLNGPNYMHVSWITKSFGNPSAVEYGTISGAYNATSTGKTNSYSYIIYKSGEIHDVVIGPLQDDTTYYYRVGGGSTEYTFKTPPPLGPGVPITFAVAVVEEPKILDVGWSSSTAQLKRVVHDSWNGYHTLLSDGRLDDGRHGPDYPHTTFAWPMTGDLGQTGWTTTTLQHMQALPYDVLIYSGDLSYADYYQPLWDSFGEIVSPLARQRPWMVTQGNHEIEKVPLFIEGFRSYNARWSMPYAESGSSSNLFYSFEVAGCHILMLGSYADYSSTSAQYKWLQADLAKVDRTKTPWLITVLHAPWYNSNTAHQGDGDAMMKSIEPLLFAAKVDILFAGHVHAYERSCLWPTPGDVGHKVSKPLFSDTMSLEGTRVYNGAPNPLGIMHITIGDGGNREGLANRYINPQPVWSLYREASFGYGQLDIQNTTTARWVWHRNDDAVDVVADEIIITSLSDPNNPAYTTTPASTSESNPTASTS